MNGRAGGECMDGGEKGEGGEDCSWGGGRAAGGHTQKNGYLNTARSRCRRRSSRHGGLESILLLLLPFALFSTPFMFVFLSMSGFVSLCLSIHLSIYLSFYLSVCIYPSTFLFFFPLSLSVSLPFTLLHCVFIHILEILITCASCVFFVILRMTFFSATTQLISSLDSHPPFGSFCKWAP